MKGCFKECKKCHRCMSLNGHKESAEHIEYKWKCDCGQESTSQEKK